MNPKLCVLAAASVMLTHFGYAEEKTQVKLTKHEKEVIEEARKTFANSKGKPPVSKHMQDKMQSTFSDPQPTETKSK